MPDVPFSSQPSLFALIVAGGAGQRMGAPQPKQFLPLLGEPVLLRTLRRFAAAVPAARRVVVLPAASHADWQKLLAGFPDAPAHRVVAGGATRLASVRAGLAALTQAGAPATALVAVHDGVRPLVPAPVIARVYQAAAATGSAVPCIPLKDSVRRLLPDGTTAAEDRAALRLVQTPQCFPLALLQAAYAAVTDTDPQLTDDASVVERFGTSLTLVEGSPENLKITTPDDLLVAEALLHSATQREGA